MTWPRPIRVVGVGSPFGDDAVAWEAVKQLRERRSWPAEIEFHMVEGGQRLLDVLDGKGSLILIDALAPANTPGNILRFAWPNSRVEVLRPGSTHNLRPAEALHLAASLDLLPRQIIVWGIEGASFTPHLHVSVVVARALVKLVEHVECELERILDEDPDRLLST